MRTRIMLLIGLIPALFEVFHDFADIAGHPQENLNAFARDRAKSIRAHMTSQDSLNTVSGHCLS